MTRCFMEARETGVAVGAHVSYSDLAGFGRRAIPMSPSEIERMVAYQLGAAQALAHYARHKITFVKAHGALANVAERDVEVADAIARAVSAVDPSLTMLTIALSEQTRAAERAGLRAAHEIFADRAYTADGRLAPRAQQGAVIEDIDAVVARVLKMLDAGGIVTQSGDLLPTRSTRFACMAIRRRRSRWRRACARRLRMRAGVCAPSPRQTCDLPCSTSARAISTPGTPRWSWSLAIAFIRRSMRAC